MTKRAAHFVRGCAPLTLPRQGLRTPWRLHQNYARDLATVRFGSMEDGVLELRRGVAAARDKSQATIHAEAA